MDASLPTQIAETIQTAHINRAPSPKHDLNPSTAASQKEPVSLVDVKPAGNHDRDSIDGEDHDDEDEVPYSVIKRRPRAANLPPMPDLRFEQSYLHSLEKADTYGKVAWITARDQVRSSIHLSFPCPGLPFCSGRRVREGE
jgi:hypothetical protein